LIGVGDYRLERCFEIPAKSINLEQRVRFAISFKARTYLAQDFRVLGKEYRTLFIARQ